MTFVSKKKTILLNITVCLFSLVVTGILLELIFARFYPQKTYNSLLKNNNNCFQKSDFAVFELKPNCSMIFQNYHTKESFSVKTNSIGYRGNEFSLNKNPNEKRILLEGDSFILGFGVKDDKVISTRLEELLNNKNNPFAQAKVINAGYAGGFGPDGYFLHLKNKGIKLDPDLVVFSVFVYNDFSDLANSNWLGTGIFGEPQKVISNTTIVDKNGYLVSKSSPFIYQIPFFRNSHLIIFFSNQINHIKVKMKYYVDKIRFKIVKPAVPSGQASDDNVLGPLVTRCLFWDSCHRQTLHLYSDLLSVVKASKKLTDDLYQDNKTHFLVVLIPADFQIYPEDYKKYQEDTGLSSDIASFTDPNPQQRLKEMLTKDKIAFLDLLPVFRNNQNRAYYAQDGHWNALGHQIAAEELAKWIKNNY